MKSFSYTPNSHSFKLAFRASTLRIQLKRIVLKVEVQKANLNEDKRILSHRHLYEFLVKRSTSNLTFTNTLTGGKKTAARQNNHSKHTTTHRECRCMVLLWNSDDEQLYTKHVPDHRPKFNLCPPHLCVADYFRPTLWRGACMCVYIYMCICKYRYHN